MTQQAPWLETAYGWAYGENGWNTGMDSNLLKFSVMFDRNVDSIVASLPPAVNGQVHYNTSDNRIYFAVNTTYFSTPVPKWFTIVVRTTGVTWQFNGTSISQVASVTTLDSRLDAVELTLSSLGSAAFEDVSAFATQVELDVVEGQAQGYTDSLRSDIASTIPTKGSSLVGGLISQSLTLNVPSQFITIQDAFTYLSKYTIARDAVVTIKVADGTYTLTGSINLNHPQGFRIQLIGNTTTPTSCVLTVTDSATFDAIVCSGGNRFGLLNGFHITRPTKAEMPKNSTGVLAVQNSTLILGSSIKVSKWFYGIAARDGSFIKCPAAQVSESGDVGIWSYGGSTVICDGAISNTANAAGQPWGFGFQAEYGSTLVGTNISASGCKIAGFASLSNSTCRIFDSSTSSNIGSGLFARDGGVIEAQNTNTTNNTRYGIEVVEGSGRIFGVSGNTGNTLGPVNAFVYLSVVGTDPQITSSSGNLRIDSRDNTYFNTAGGAQFCVRNTPSAVNRIDVIGAATGQSPQFIATGTDTNIDLALTPKGSGRVKVGATFTGTVSTNSYIEFLSNDGAVLRIPVQRL